MLCRWVMIVGLLLAATPAPACRLALALGFDVSRSVDSTEYQAQIDGIVSAFLDPEVRAAILGGGTPIAVMAFEWSGARHQSTIAGWRLLDSPEAIDTLALQISNHRRSGAGVTAVGAALTHALEQFETAPSCDRQTLDLAGDGPQNSGPEPRRIYDTRNLGDLTVNGLAIGGNDARVLDWFRRNVLFGRGAFVEHAQDHADFARAFRRKLIRELRIDLLGSLSD